MNECWNAILKFDDAIDEALGHLAMAVEPHHRCDPIAWGRMQVLRDALLQAALDLQSAIVAVMVTETAD